METAKRLSVRELPVTSEPGRRRHKALLRYPPNISQSPKTLFFELEGECLPSPPDRQDHLALALLFFAMRHGTDLHIEGRLSRELLENLEEFQRAWSTWRPERYRPVQISCDEELDPVFPEPRHRAVVALSGGVDGTFAMLEHGGNSTARDRRELVAAMLVHGFDIPLEASGAFDVTRANSRAMAACLGLPLTVIRTDWRRGFSHNWEDDFAAGLAACFHLFAGAAEFGLMAAGADYARLVFPMGENPITNTMMSSDRFRIQMVGYAHSRTEKVAAIAAHGDLAEHLRVCWEGPRTGRNCGRCEKCVRTKLNFLAAGYQPPDCLGAVPGFGEVVALRAPNLSSIKMLRDVHDAGRAGPLSADMSLAVKLCLARNLLLLPLRAWRRVLRRTFRWFTPWRKQQ